MALISSILRRSATSGGGKCLYYRRFFSSHPIIKETPDPNKSISCMSVKKLLTQLQDIDSLTKGLLSEVRSICKDKGGNENGESDLTETQSLLQLVESEVVRVSTQVMKIPDDFPFKKNENAEHDGYCVNFWRVQEDEVINIQIAHNEAVAHEVVDEFSMPLTVTVTRHESFGQNLKFSCVALPEKIIIERVTVKNREFTGLKYEEMNEDLQKELHMYLEMREIKPCTTTFLYKYINHKADKEHLNFLGELQKFLNN